MSAAKQAVYKFNGILKKTHAKSPDEFLRRLFNTKNDISAALKEPLVKNSLAYLLYDVPKYSIPTAKGVISQRIQFVLDHLTNSSKNIAEYGYPKIKNGMIVFIHGYSSAAVQLLLEAKSHNLHFAVHNTEARPNFGGRLAASVLAKHDIHVKQYTDLAMRQALKNTDIILLDGFLFTEQGHVYGTIGAELLAEMAEKFEIPLYVCMDTWKCNPSPYYVHEHSVEQAAKELWQHAPKNVSPLNFGFEKIHPRLITGIITEQGIYKPQYLLAEIKKQQSWMLK